MALPETILVRYTEEDAGFIDVRPVVQQSFQLRELLDLVLSVTGKDAARVQHILRSGTVVYHFFRYKWTGFEAGPQELSALLAQYPDADPARVFRAEECSSVLLESTQPAGRQVQIEKKFAERKRFLRSGTLWNSLMAAASKKAPTYREYSYALHGDLFHLEQTHSEWSELLVQAKRLSHGDLKARLNAVKPPIRLIFIMPRRS